MAVRSSKKRAGVVSVDFTGVSAEGGGRLLPEGPMVFEVDEIEEKEGEESGQPYLQMKLKVVDGDYKGTIAYDNFSLQPQALWKLRGFLEAAGMATEDGPMDLNLSEMEGFVVIGDVIHEDYKGKTKHRINAYSAAEDSQPEAQPEAPSRPRRPARDEGDDDKKAEWKVKQSVKFKDGKKTVEGVITKIDGDTITVKAGRDEYEMGPDDIEAA